MELSPRLIEGLIYGFGTQRRQTQDSPVLPDVWAYYATPSLEPVKKRMSRAETDERPLELLLTPHFDAGPAILAVELRERLKQLRESSKDKRKPARIAYTQSYVVAQLYFDEIVRVLIPLTPWWRSYVWRGVFKDDDDDAQDDRTLANLLERFERRGLEKVFEIWNRTQMPERYRRADLEAETLWSQLSSSSREGEVPVSEDNLWMVRIIGTIQWARQVSAGEARELGSEIDPQGRITSLPRTADGNVYYSPLIAAALDLLQCDLPIVQSRQASLWTINRNRAAESAVSDSRRAIKADAAKRLFDIQCKDLTWAVLDSGIDARHTAFRKSDADPDKPWGKGTRITKTYDFTRLRPLFDQEVVRDLLNAENIIEQSFNDEELDIQLAPIRRLIAREDEVDKARQEGGAGRFDPSRRRLRTQLEELMKRIDKGREIDWELLDPLLEVPYDDSYPVPTDRHGTHVAGILAADWPEEELTGVCPDIRIYDLRVLDPHGPNDEFTVLAALQFIQYLNLQKDVLNILGANLSLSIHHQVSNYACGRTPVCEECNRLVASGVVVVAAGGNAGYDQDLARAAAGAGYRTVSITDPGNAEAVITVGATHRDQPHTYGVSFFSSRGPTGDGRAKPDLVAPGEKITSTIPGEALKREDGTSMAAPHVSGAAALLMARHQELMGQPQSVKKILCDTATDLGRERHFQGAGMLDVLRALQSV